ncbi:hypothetical protein BX600DRAFT_428770 [Xylariales sp. PMI_506]|nr:hypothetical protein BX600DRAFT_428770 [Xylariales sp. PMI_506]
MATNKKSDIVLLWERALKAYKEEAGVDLESADNRKLCEEVNKFQSEIGTTDDENKVIDAFLTNNVDSYKTARNDGKALGELRHTLGKLSKHLSAVISAGGDVAGLFFSPAPVIVVALTRVFGACATVSKDLDSIESLFTIMLSFTKRLKLIQPNIPKEPVYQDFVVGTLIAMLSFCACAHKKLAKDKFRFKQWAKALFGGEDAVLKTAYDQVVTSINNLDSATAMQTLAVVMQEKDVHKENHTAIMDVLSFLKNQMQSSNRIRMREERAYEQGDQRARISSYGVPGAMAHEGDGFADQKVGIFESLKHSLSPKAQERMLQRWTSMDQEYVPETLDWIHELPEFTEWKDGGNFLFIKGAAGTGKSLVAYKIWSLLVAEFRPGSETSVACFSFDRNDEEFNSVQNMVTFCSSQIACIDSSYLNEISTFLQSKESASDWYEKCWEELFQQPFKSSDDAKRKAFIILDGIDQLDENEYDKLVSYLRQVKLCNLQLSFIFTGMENRLEIGESVKTVDIWENGGQRVASDIEKVVKARMENLKKLSQLRRRIKKDIVVAIKKNADSFIYVDHMLRRYEAFGSAALIAKALTTPPRNTDGIYEELFDECQQQFDEKGQTLIGYLFVWLASTKDRLSLGDAQVLLNLVAAALEINQIPQIEDEITSRLSKVLSISDQYGQEDEDVDGSDLSETESDDNYNIANGNIFGSNNATPSTAFLGFQESHLGLYFSRETPRQNGTSLRPFTDKARFMKLEMSTLILAALSEDKNDLSAESKLVSVAARCWAEDLAQLAKEIENADTNQIKRLVLALQRLFHKAGKGFKALENNIDQYDDGAHFSILESPTSREDDALFTLFRIGERSAELLTAVKIDEGHDLAQNEGEAYRWAESTFESSDAVFGFTGTLHIDSWFSATHPSFAYGSFRCALEALFKTSHGVRGLQADLDITFTDDDFEAKPFMPNAYIITDDVFETVAKHGDRELGATAHKCISMALFFDNRTKTALQKANIGADLTQDARDKFDLRYRVARTHFQIWMDDYKSLHERFRILDQDSDEDLEALANLEQVLSRLDEAIGTIPPGDTSKDDLELKTNINMAYQMKARLEILIPSRRYQALHTMRHLGSDAAIPASSVRFLDELVEGFAMHGDWKSIIQLLDLLNNPLSGNCAGITHVYIQKAAAHTKDDVHRYYKMAIDQPDKDGVEIAKTRRWLASFEMYFLDNPEAAKEQLQKILDQPGVDRSWYLPAASRLANVLTIEFQRSSDLGTKQRKVEELEKVISTVESRLGFEFNAMENNLNIPLSIMLRKLGPATRYFDSLNAMFCSSLTALSDKYASNDAQNLRMLAKMLSLVPGGEKDAQIALSFQFDHLTTPPQTFSTMCSSCRDTLDGFGGGSIYLCCYCTNVDLCKKCYEARKRYNEDGVQTVAFVEVCPSNHAHIEASSKDRQTIAFDDWRNGLSAKWLDWWKEYWTQDDIRGRVETP